MRQSHNSFLILYVIFLVHSVKLLKLWIKHRKTIYRNRIRIRFIKFCIQHDVVPPHLYRIHNFNLNLYHHSSISKFYVLMDIYIQKKLLKMGLNDSYRLINHSQTKIFQLARDITHNFPFYIYNSFFA